MIPVEITKIIEDGVKAPSGENCQPWRFIIQGGEVLVFNVPDADISLYNLEQKGSYIAHGALLENIRISALHYGYAVEIVLFPDEKDTTHVATLTFKKNAPVENTLYKAIDTRCTNRKEYTGEKLSNKEKETLIEAVRSIPSYDFLLVDDDTILPSMGKALAAHEKVLFEHRKMHDFFYDHILWDKKDEAKAGGFYIKTLEFLPHQLGAVKVFKHWPLLVVLNKIIGVSTMISKDNGEKYARSGTFGAITMKDSSDKDYVYLGMTMQRVWLTATNLDIAMHPCNGTLYLMKHIISQGDKEFSKKHRSLIKESYADILSQFDSKDGEVVFIFRLGKAEPPTATAHRVKPFITYS